MPRLSDYTEILPAGTIDAWPAVAAALPLRSTLMGGTGLAIWLRHRRSADLDLFVAERLEADRIVSALTAAGEFACTDASERLIRGRFNSVNVDIVAQQGAPTLGPPLMIDGLHVGSLQDITAGKFSAVVGRKQMRDFIDVMFIETQGGVRLEQGVMLYLRKQGIDLHPAVVGGILRHLVDFRHLDDDPAMVAAFGDGIRERVEDFFRFRQPQVASAFERLLERNG